MSDAIDDISERINIFYLCTYKSLVFGAKTLEIILQIHFSKGHLIYVTHIIHQKL